MSVFDNIATTFRFSKYFSSRRVKLKKHVCKKRIQITLKRWNVCRALALLHIYNKILGFRFAAWPGSINNVLMRSILEFDIGVPLMDSNVTLLRLNAFVIRPFFCLSFFLL